MRVRTAMAVVAAAGAGLMVYSLDPTTHAFYPRCVLHALTGLECPGCGSTRALYFLLHGRLAAAFNMNPLAILFSPAVVAGVTTGRSNLTDRPWLGWAIAATVVLFGVVRNLPFYPWFR
jgi:hypothetical protein